MMAEAAVENTGRSSSLSAAPDPPAPSSPTASTEADRLLSAFLQEEDDRRAWALFDRLFAFHASWLKRYVQTHPAAHDDTEDLLQDIHVKVWRSLERIRTSGGAPVRSFRAYARVVARSVIVDSGPRREYREYANLFRAIRYVLGPRCPAPFGMWSWNGAQACGMLSWRDDPARQAAFQAGRAPSFSHEALSELHSFLDLNDPKGDRRNDLPLLVGLVLHWLDAPVRLDALVEWVGAACGLQPVRVVTEADLRDEEGEIPAYAVAATPGPDQGLMGVDALRAAFLTLPPNSRLALINGMDAAAAIAFLGEAGIRTTLAPLTDCPGSGFTERTLLQNLPLKDDRLAALLNITTNYLHVLRNRARTALAKKISELSDGV